jgi:hypothetical protein
VLTVLNACETCTDFASSSLQLEKVKKAAATATAVPTHSSTASAAASALSAAGTVPIIKANVASPPIPPQDQPQTTKALKNKIAVMEDALSEMRNEAPRMRECMAWMWEIIGNERRNRVPNQLRDMYHEMMVVDLVDWQLKGRVGGGGGGGGKKVNVNVKNTKGRGEVKVEKKNSLTANNVVAGVKRKSVSPLAHDTKKLKIKGEHV